MSKVIQYLLHNQINKAKWDNLIERAPNGFIYNRSFFLDALCDWDALIEGDYEIVMPLPNRSKWGLCYIHTPFFIGQMGIVSRCKVDNHTVARFLQAIPERFSYIDIQLNEENIVEIPRKNITVQQRSNYILPLNRPYHLIESNYSKDAKKNLRQAAQFKLTAVENIDVLLVVQYFRQAYGALNYKIGEAAYIGFIEACKTAIDKGLGFTFGLKTAEGEIVSAAFLGKDNKRIYYICGAPSKTGRTMNAQHVLIDELLKKYAATGLVFDFEGSDIPAVARFYKKFSPQLKIYQQVTINRLPFWLKWLKK